MVGKIVVFFVMFLCNGVLIGVLILRHINIDSTDMETRMTGLIPDRKLTSYSKRGYLWLWLVSSLALTIVMWTIWLLS